MSKKIFFAIIVIIILATFSTAIVLWKNNSQNYNGNQGVSSLCAKEGESVGSCSDCIRQCCSGLEALPTLKYNGKCVEILAPGTSATCTAKCGNGVCDADVAEDECNCPTDCKKQPVDISVDQNIDSNFSCESEPDNQTAKVKIVMDKIEYQKGEEINFSADIEGSVYVYSMDEWTIDKCQNGSWVNFMNSGGCGNNINCELINSNGIENCNFPLCERPIWYKTQDSYPYANWKWNQKYIADEKDYKCKWESSIADAKCVVYDQISSGKYRVNYKYALSVDKNDLSKTEGIEIKRAEKTFIIE